MFAKETIKIGYLDSKTSKTTKLLTSDNLEALMKSVLIRNVMKKIEAETDQQKKNELKGKLPAAMFVCQWREDGVRPTKDMAEPSGFCMHDWDHMTENPREFYEKNIRGRERESGILLAHVTPRGEGLRLVTVMKDGESIMQCQERMAAMFGMDSRKDESVKDITRISFIPSYEYLLYIDNEGLFSHQMNASSEEAATAENLEEAVKEELLPMDTCNSERPATATNIADCFYYEGLKFSQIIEALLNRIATNGSPRDGERNTDLFMLVRELRHICHYEFSQIYRLVQPYFPTLSDSEIRRTVSNAIATNGRTITPVMRGVLNELHNEDVNTDTDEEKTKQTKLPKLSPVEEMIIAHFPKPLRPQVYLAMLPIWGVYGTHVRFDFPDGRLNSLSFMTAVVGKSASGKGFAAMLFEMMTKRFCAEDAIERKKADEYLARCNKAGNNSDKPDDPRPRVRLYGDDITTSQLLEYLDNLGGEHGLQFTEEVARLNKAKRTIYGDNDDLYCKAFENGLAGKESKSKATRNIRIPIFLNCLFCGTPGAMYKFYGNPEGGLNNRIIYNFMPTTRMKGFPRVLPLNEAEQAQFDDVCNSLWQAGQDGVKLKLPWLEKAICMIRNRWDMEDKENPDEVWLSLGRRSLVLAMRAGVLEWLLRGCPEDKKQIQAIVKLVKWVAETVRRNVYAFSGEEYELINEKDNLYQQKQHVTKNKKLFSLLKDEFTTQELVALRIQNGDSTNVRMVLSRWVSDGMILKQGQGRYKKVPVLEKEAV